mmetsp:Transcript_18152/g.22557  ORF Transcript_18152/g.22557 Transcript_18152/m.22557 type:complete len:264 (+) Transcript_18152:560-1351(+)
MVLQILRHFHLHCPAASHNSLTIQTLFHNHQRIMNTPLTLRNKLFTASPQHKRKRQFRRTLRKDIEPLISDPPLLKTAARSQNTLPFEITGTRLNTPPRSLGHPLQIRILHASRAEHTPVRKVLSRQIANGKFTQHNIRATIYARVEFIVNNLPFRINNALVLIGIRNADFGVLFLRLKFQFHVQKQNFWITELFRHLLKPRVRKRLFERDPIHQKTLLHIAPRNLLHRNQTICLVQHTTLVQTRHRVNDHGREKVLLTGNKF